ncbi:MAG: hypothetical protein KAT34_09205 [Candidatus Aminicenantes bacterium]|nr:hypothetical protein [Candidatus Aminicenantes bacterium]
MEKKISKKKRAAILSTILIIFHFVQFSLAEESAGENKGSYLSVGVGLGIPYGVLGINLEFNPNLPAPIKENIHNYFSISIGVGYSPGGISYSVGLRGYPMGRRKFYQPRISGYYGTVALLKYASGDYDREDGFAFGGGVLVKFYKQFSLDFDALYIIPDDYTDYIKGSRLKISFGIHWHPQ